jgi:hypothetical protein
LSAIFESGEGAHKRLLRYIFRIGRPPQYCESDQERWPQQGTRERGQRFCFSRTRPGDESGGIRPG